MRSLRILHAPADVGGHAFGLSRAERALGHGSDVVVFAAGPYGYGADVRVDLDGEPAWRRLALRAAWIRRAVPRYDVFHFNFGQPLLALRHRRAMLSELPLLQRAGKTVLVTFQGCDVRPQHACHCTAERCTRETPLRSVNAGHMRRHADRVYYLNPDLRRWLPEGSFLPYASVDVRALAAVPAPSGETLVVAHAPTNREVKGTDVVVAAVDALRQEGVRVRLDLVEGVPRDEVVRRLSQADVVVDQLRIGWYGGLAVEAMAIGRPVLASIDEREPADNPFGSELPIVRTSAGTFRDDLRRLLDDAEARREAGARGRAFAERVHDPRAVAATVLDGLA